MIGAPEYCPDMIQTHSTFIQTKDCTTNSENAEKQALLLFSNPVSEFLRIKINDNYKRAEIKVLNNCGMEIMAWPVRGGLIVKDISFLGSGIYYITLLEQGKIVGINKLLKL